MSIPERARVVLLRHGETEWSAQGLHTGRTDLPLTENGERQARAAGQLLRALGLRAPRVYTSPRQRAIRTAELAGLPEPTVHADLAEWDYGDYEGRSTPDIRTTCPGWTIWTHPVPGGESADAVRDRADRMLDTVRRDLPHRDVVLVGHGHFSRVLITRWARFDVREGRRFAMSTAAVSVLGFEHEDNAIVAHNLVPTMLAEAAS